MLRYAISNGQFALGHQFGHETQPLRARLCAEARALATERVDFFLLREPGLPAGTLAALAREILAILIDTPTQLLLHSRADIAAAIRTSGVHLPANPDALTPDQVRTVYASARHPNPMISLACHTPGDLANARKLRPDLILFSPVFGKSIAGRQVTPPAGLEALREACHLAAPIPVLALGGVTEANTPACLAAGATGIAAIRLFSHTPAPQLN